MAPIIGHVETVYVETTIPSYLTAHRAVREPMASHQQITKDWWGQVSDLLIDCGSRRDLQR